MDFVAHPHFTTVSHCVTRWPNAGSRASCITKLRGKDAVKKREIQHLVLDDGLLQFSQQRLDIGQGAPNALIAEVVEAATKEADFVGRHPAPADVIPDTGQVLTGGRAFAGGLA